PPGEEAIELERTVGRAGEAAILGLPVPGATLPAVEVFAVEDRYETLGGLGFGGVITRTGLRGDRQKSQQAQGESEPSGSHLVPSRGGGEGIEPKNDQHEAGPRSLVISGYGGPSRPRGHAPRL